MTADARASQCNAGAAVPGHQAARFSVLPASSRRAFRHGASGLLSRSIFSMTFAFVTGSLATPYRTLPLRERTSVTHPHGPFEVRSVTRLPLVTAVPAQVVAFARLFAPPLRVRVAVEGPSSSIPRGSRAPSSLKRAPTPPRGPCQAPLNSPARAGPPGAPLGSVMPG